MVGWQSAVSEVETNGAATVVGEMVEHADLSTPLPTEMQATLSFVKRLPTQRLLDSLAHYDSTPYGELQEQMPSRVLAFRLLVREYPNRDLGSLWQHAYDVEIEIVDSDPTSALGQMPSLPSAPTST
jgi:hypothetical protein